MLHPTDLFFFPQVPRPVLTTIGHRSCKKETKRQGDKVRETLYSPEDSNALAVENCTMEHWERGQVTCGPIDPLSTLKGERIRPTNANRKRIIEALQGLVVHKDPRM